MGGLSPQSPQARGEAPSGRRVEFVAEATADTDSRARCGYLCTAHGRVRMPGFLPVATRGAVRLLDWADIATLGFDAVLVNSYHLMLRPGIDHIEAAGGLHSFSGWKGPILTDSGGFQAMSLGGVASQEGIAFRSVYDGTRHLLTPEEALRVQAALGVDIAVALDECPRLPAPLERVRAATYRSLRWARQSIEAFRRSRSYGSQLLVGVVQGGVDEELRRQAAAAMAEMDFDAYAIGGLSVGESFEERVAVLDIVSEILPQERPRYLMGVGDPPTIVEAVWRGVDLFDSVLPTRLGRHGTALVREGRLNLRASSSARHDVPIDPNCTCFACCSHSRAYIRHLLLVGEETGRRLVSLHNLHFINTLFEEMRQAIQSGALGALREKILTLWSRGR